MNKEFFKSDRYFVVFDFKVSHGQLLLRSSKGEEFNNNIDVIFFDTNFIHLLTSFNGIIVRLMDNSPEIDYKPIAKNLRSKNKNVFEIESNGEKFYVTASFVLVYENNLEFSESSLGFENKGREKEIATSR